MATYLGFDIWDTAAEGILDERQRHNSVVMGQPWQSRLKFEEESNEYLLHFIITQQTNAARKLLRDRFDGVKGSEGKFWIRSFKNDYVLSQPAPVGAAAITVTWEDQPAGVDKIERHVYIPKLGDNYEIDNPSFLASWESVMAISPVLTGALLAGDVVENLFLCKFASDALEFVASGAYVAGVEVTTVEVALAEVQGETP